jgi:hypothetical protein
MTYFTGRRSLTVFSQTERTAPILVALLLSYAFLVSLVNLYVFWQVSHLSVFDATM